jgi:predicted LPLAT superfamily acyltransferase
LYRLTGKGRRDRLAEKTLEKAPVYGSNLGFRFFHVFIKIAGPVSAYMLLALILPYYLLIRGSARRSASYYIKHRFPEYGLVRTFFSTYYYFLQFGKGLIDQACVSIIDREKFKVDFRDKEKLRNIAKAGKGMVLLTTHAGNWMTAMTAMDNMSVPVNLLLDVNNSEGRHFFDVSGGEKIKFIPPAGFMGGLVAATNALNEGEIVSIMGDRREGARVIYVDFLGEKAPFPVTPYHLSYATGADIVVLLTVRTGMLSFSIEAHCITEGMDLAAKGRDETMKELAEKYVALLEKYSSKHPFMWYNFFDFWNEEDEELKRVAA